MNKGLTREELKQQLNRKGYRLTRPREIVLEVLRAVSHHPDADWVYRQVRQQVPHVSLGTIYRTLSLFAEVGLIREFHGEGSQARYDGDTSDHYHVICRECGALQDMPMPTLQQLAQQAAQWTDFRVEGYRLDFYGLCPRCQQGEKAQAASG